MKMKYDYVLFDLDGTLTDSAEGIINALRYSLDKMGLVAGNREELNRFIGPPLWETFEKYYGLSKEKADDAVKIFREYYSEKGWSENSVYNGIEEMLKTLRANGLKLVVATSKSELYAGKILEHFGISGYFEFIAGSSHDGTRVKKEEVIGYAIESCGIIDLERVIMVGDRENDIIGARYNGVRSIGVLFGYGSLEELEMAGADYIAKTPADIGRIILNGQV
ncbi:MAG: HAD family hydrolase [Clostridiales bacterium]|nr:HAD family hydrolase [Clostridiales bacterium]